MLNSSMQRAQQLGRYLLLDRIAYGGMAEIYRAKTFDRDGRAHLVAVKRVLDHLTADEEFIKMLVDEAKLTALLRHENIAKMYEFVHTEDDEYFIAMEWVDGKDVRSLLERHRARKQPIPPEHAAWIIMEVANALHVAHSQVDGQGKPLNIVHRDVSPSNVLCAYAGEVKLCDFGIAKATLTRVQTRTGVIKGKVKYMSPEQALGRKLDARSDLFSLGTMLYEMVTLEAPFQAPTEVELIFAVRDATKKDAKQVVPSLPDELNAIVNKAMTRSRSGRFQNGREMAQALRDFLDIYQPGYRRSHFGRFMRQEFAKEIEKELRQLEEFSIEEGNPEEVGENLIADALGPDAQYTQFTAHATVAREQQAGRAPRLHDFDESEVSSSGDKTPIFQRAVEVPDDPAVPASTLHTDATRIIQKPDAPPRPSDPAAELHALSTRIVGTGQTQGPAERPGGLHDQETRILANPLLKPQPAAAAPVKKFEELHTLATRIMNVGDKRAAAPVGGEAEKAKGPRPMAGGPGREETTSVPLDESDLEEV